MTASTEPMWSPDGTKIALLGTHKGGYWNEDLANVFILDPAAGTERLVGMQIHSTDWLHRMRIFWSGIDSEAGIWRNHLSLRVSAVEFRQFDSRRIRLQSCAPRRASRAVRSCLSSGLW